MITFRFYLVTLVAIFLAVALGVVIGSTFLEPALVQDLNNQVEGVRDSLDERVRLIDDLNTEIEDLDAYLEQSAPFAVDSRLDGSRVLVTAEEGLDDGTMQRLVGRLRQAGASVEGVLWIQPGWGTGDQTAEVLTALALTDVAPSDVAEVRRATWEALVDEAEGTVDEAPDATTTTTAGSPDTSTTTDTVAPTTTSTTAPPLFESPVLGVLADADWIRLEPIDVPEAGVTVDAPPSDAPAFAVVLATGPASETTDTTEGVVELARHLANRGIATLVAEAWVEIEGDDGEIVGARGDHVAPVRDDTELSTLVSTVDDLDLIQGQVATALAIEDLGRGVAGHYGYGDGAELVLPQWLDP